jgi:ribonuclease J
VVDAKNLGKYDDAIIVIMNAKHEMFEQLHQIITNNDPNLQFRPNDTFFFASQTINGLERKEANLFNDLSLIDIHQAIKIDKKYHDLRPAAEDHKYITSLVNPQFIIPCSGLYMDFIKYKNIVSRIVVNSTDKQQKVLIIPNGLFLEFNDRVVKSNVKPVLDLRPSPINLQGEIEFFDSLIRESTQMQANGIMLVNFLIDKKLKKITKTAYDLLGVIDLDGPAKEALKQIETDAENNANKLLDDYDRPEFDIKEFKNTIRKKVSKLMHGRFEKDPIVVVSTLFL